jgi:hypothetical protein
MIKQIQLRGISRTPSDRLSEDGGLSESLNMYLDTAESAPALLPKDITTNLSLPTDLLADKVFVHKTADYEHYIVVDKDSIVAYIGTMEQKLLTLQDGESLIDLNSLGNVLILATSASVHYVLWKGNEYKYIGNKIPAPVVRFETEHNNEVYLEPAKAGGTIYLDTSNSVTGRLPISSFDANAWRLAVRGVHQTEETNAYLAQVNKDLWAAIQEKKNYIAKWGYFCCPRFVRYAVRLYDGTYIYHSVPFLIGAGEEAWVSADGYVTTNEGKVLNSRIDFFIHRYYKAIAKLISWDIDGWEDIVSGLDVFISTDITFPTINASFEGVEDGGGKIYFKGYQNALEESKREVLSKSNFYKVYSIGVRELSKLKNGINLHDNDFVDDNSLLVQQERLTSDYMTNHSIIPSSMETFNNSLLINGSAVYLPDAPMELNGLVGGTFPEESFRIKFYLKRNNGDIYTILARDENGNTEIKAPTFPYMDEVHGVGFVRTFPYAWIAYPDPNCFKVEIQTVNENRFFSIDMEQHPSLYLSCAYLGMNKAWTDSTDVPGEFDLSEERSKYSIENQVMVSMVNNPFIFPPEGRFTFQSKVLGLAIATTALSQGQFGQFPIYVFTEDGIWAMETAADGSFVSQKPLSREVCSNPNSITSIDNAVVFVTKKAVMLIQGSEVINISPFMNGRHYEPNDSAKSIISKQEGFADLVTTIEDTDSFMSFMQDAKVAYDYTGQRLIFISPANKDFQYLYKIDTQTWHKLSLDETFVDPLNSYPECYVSALGGTISRWTVWVDSPLDSEEEAETWVDDIYYDFRRFFPNGIGDLKVITEDAIIKLLCGKIEIRDITNEEDATLVASTLNHWADRDAIIKEHRYVTTKILDMGTILSPDFNQKTAKGILITRPFDLGMPDVFKSIIDIRIRGDYDKGNVKYILQGSDDGRIFYTLTSLRGKSWKMFRIFILADLEPTERISWIDVDFEPRYNNRLR